MKRITITTVADRAGVSTAAVSYALSGKKKISPKVLIKIQQAIDELGYKPNILARNLASKKTWTVGLYTSPTQNIRGDVFFNSLLAGILDNLHEKKYQLHLYADYLKIGQENSSDLSMTQPIDGAIIMNPRVNDIYLQYLEKQKIPFVVMGTPDESEKKFYVDVDLTAAAYTATKFLIAKGHRNILFLNGPLNYIQSIHHIKGSEMAFQEAGLHIDAAAIRNIPMNEEESYKELEKIEDELKHYSAIFACHDIFSFGIVRFLRERRINIPADLAYISLGNSPFCRICTPALTSVDLAPYDMGYKSAEMLIDVIEKKRIQPSHMIIPANLVVRESV